MFIVGWVCYRNVYSRSAQEPTFPRCEGAIPKRIPDLHKNVVNPDWGGMPFPDLPRNLLFRGWSGCSVSMNLKWEVKLNNLLTTATMCTNVYSR